MEVTGPTTGRKLAGLFPGRQLEKSIPRSLHWKPRVLFSGGKFHLDADKNANRCDRRLLARIHRLTLNRLRAEIQPVSIADFQRFLVAWQRVEIQHRVEGVDGTRAVLELFDGYELPAAAWEPEVLALRVKEYQPTWLDQLCFTGRLGWGRLTAPQKINGKTNETTRHYLSVPAPFPCFRARTLLIG